MNRTKPNRSGAAPIFFQNRVYPAANEHCYGKWPSIDGFSIQKRLAFYVLARNTSKYHAVVCLLTPAGNAIAHAVAQSSRAHVHYMKRNVLVVVGENLDPFQQASLNLNLLKINLGRTGKLQEMITTDCWS